MKEKIIRFFKEFDKKKLLSSLQKIQVKSFFKKYSASLWIILISYMLSSIVASTVSVILLSLSNPLATSAKPETVAPPVQGTFNYKEAKDAVLDRNLFNLAGSLPEENDNQDTGIFSTFDPNAPCSPSSLGLSILGVISQGPKSVVTIKDSQSDYTDFYTVGDAIIDKDGASIYSISPDLVVINNKGNKECLINVVKNIDKVLDEMGVSVIPQEYNQVSSGSGGARSACGLVTLSENFINAELGVGFSNILGKAKVIPNITESGMTGFKLLGIVPGSIFDRICLKDQDIVTQVNDTSLLDPDQGFALYEAFQKDRDIHIQFLRNGEPMVVDIRQE